jgi:hypothetical protein
MMPAFLHLLMASCVCVQVYELFDTLALLAQGATVYFGPAQAAGEFFASVGLPAPQTRSVSDHLLHTINADFGHAKEVEDNIQRCVTACSCSTAWLAC